MLNMKNLYETSTVTLDEACFAIIYFIDRFSLSEIAKKKLIELIKFLIPYKNNLPNTVYKISKIVSLSEYKPSTVNFCKNCSNETTANFNQCTNENCLEYEKVSKSFDTFKYFDIERPLKNLVKSNLPKIISCTEGSFNDILDGSHYKNISKSNYLNLMVYTDGIQISKSNKLNFWPVICGLEDLPIKIRDSIKNKIIFGVWQGKKKPTSDILFRYLKNSILKINQNGINVEQGEYKKTFYFQIYGILCDTPAKALVLNMNQFNGHYGCLYCFNPGKWSKFYHKMLYEQTDYPLRNNDDFRSDYQDGTDIETVNGLKGDIELSDMIILPNSVPIDYMHMVCLGIFKNLLKLCNSILDAALHFEIVSRLGEFENSKEKTELNDFILDLYSKKHFGNIKVSLLEPTSKRKLNNFELNQFELDDFFNDVFISLRIIIENTIYHSINYKRVGQETSSYCIKYKIQNLFYFGFIKYFIEIENFFYVVLCPLKTIKTCLFNDIKIRVPDDLQALKKNKIFDNFFTVCEKTENLLIINSDDVISKCIIYEENEDLFYLSDYLSEEEHD
ncbi:unnamed protein product [Brachionus calyciflorus]|uniref:Uncharacterized protein n=1 Tax=Brachionus calyciflorus TaxID=104777 RepID=A0A814CV42_9BILA|nr:unnamed protein product [Brachionus calyciflorus]